MIRWSKWFSYFYQIAMRWRKRKIVFVAGPSCYHAHYHCFGNLAIWWSSTCCHLCLIHSSEVSGLLGAWNSRIWNLAGYFQIHLIICREGSLMPKLFLGLINLGLDVLRNVHMIMIHQIHRPRVGCMFVATIWTNVEASISLPWSPLSFGWGE